MTLTFLCKVDIPIIADTLSRAVPDKETEENTKNAYSTNGLLVHERHVKTPHQ